MEHTAAVKIVAIGTAFAFRGALFVDAVNHPTLPVGLTAPTWGITAGSTVSSINLNMQIVAPVIWRNA